MIAYGGLIRGAIAFGLVLKIPKNNLFRETDIFVTTTLALVIITTLVFGTFMPLVQKILVPPDENVTENGSSAEVVTEDNQSSTEHYETLLHPNMENTDP